MARPDREQPDGTAGCIAGTWAHLARAARIRCDRDDDVSSSPESADMLSELGLHSFLPFV